MSPDDELCLCFHVTQRKVVNFIRIEKPKRPAQLSECFGAGTGCGWCRPFLERLFEQAVLGGETQRRFSDAGGIRQDAGQVCSRGRRHAAAGRHAAARRGSADREPADLRRWSTAHRQLAKR